MVAEEAVAEAVAKGVVRVPQDKARDPIHPRLEGYVLPWDPMYLTTAIKEPQMI